MIPLPEGPFQIIYADPPWHYRGRKQFGKKGMPNSLDVGVDSGGAVMHYNTMLVEEICSMADDVSRISHKDALLYIWIPNPLLPDGLRVIDAWGFKYATVAFVWFKRATNPGYYTLSQCELCLVAKRGKIPQPRGSRNERQLVVEKRGKHSAKPAGVRDRITRMFPTQRKIELFSRDRVDGWDAWGNEVPDV